MPLHHRTIGFSRARIIVMPLCPNSTSPTLGNRTSDPDTLSILSLLSFHHSPSALSILSLLACHHSSAALSIHLSLPHGSSPPHFTLPSMTCVLKRFPLTSPRKLSLTCVKRGFLRTAEPHRTLQISPCAPLVSQCHVYAMPGRDVPCSFTTAPSTPPARELLSCPCVLTPHLPPWSIAHLIPTHSPSSPYSLSITLPPHFPSVCRLHTGHLRTFPRFLPRRAY